MNRITLQAAATMGVFFAHGAFGSSVWAADMPVRQVPPPPAVYDWTGLYIGGHIGGGWEGQRFNDPVGYNTINATTNTDWFSSGPGAPNVSSSSFLGGLQAGANYQIGRLVLGSEFDVSWLHLNSSTTGAFTAAPPFPTFVGTESFSSSTNWIATATTRLGVARDTWLFYGKAGAAWAGSTNGVAITAFNSAAAGVTSLAGTLNDTRLGWTVGTGIEWAFAKNWTTKLEYDYMDFGTKVENISTAGLLGAGGAVGPFAASLPVNVSQSVSLVKWGVNYKLDPGFLFW
jgi:outer membrane immunogenic protein